MLSFKLKDKKLVESTLEESVWIDLLNPTVEERELLQTQLNQNLTSFSELEDIEASARFFEDENGLHLHSFFYSDEELTSVAFTLNNNRLFTLRDRELSAFRLYRLRSHNQVQSAELLLDLFEIKIEQLANVIENVYGKLEDLSHTILQGEQDKMNQALSILTKQEDVSAKVRLCLIDTQRALSFLIRKTRLPTELLEQAREILRDIESLQPHNEAIFQKVSFLMQAAMGFINIEQNRIIKIFSVVSVIFLPPTLVASNYGMNFSNMPELGFKLGYPMALGLMALAAPLIGFLKEKVGCNYLNISGGFEKKPKHLTCSTVL